MTYEVQFKSPGKFMPFQYRDYTVKAKNVIQAEKKAFEQLQLDESVDSDWIKNAIVDEITNSSE